jgi:hypothetical protein
MGATEELTTHHCYLFVTSEKTWEEAKKACSDVGLYLASITSPEEVALITPFNNGDDRWLGGLNVNGVWTWVNGEPWGGFAVWGPGQPNGSGTCLALRTMNNTWNDDVCTEPHDFVCEWTPPGNNL